MIIYIDIFTGTHQIVCVFGVFEQSKSFELKLDDKDNSPEK